MKKIATTLVASLLAASLFAAKVTPEATDEILINPGMGICHYYYSNRIWAYGSQHEPGDVLDWMPGTRVIY